MSLASLPLTLHRWVIWKDSRIARAFLLLLALGQWTLLVLGTSASPPSSLACPCLLSSDVANIKAMKDDCVCIVYPTYPQMNGVTLIYSESGCYTRIGALFIRRISATFFDLVVLVLSVLGLSSQRCESPLKRRLRAQGIMYFAVAGIAYIPPMVWIFLVLHPVPCSHRPSRFLLYSITLVRSHPFRCCP